MFRRIAILVLGTVAAFVVFYLPMSFMVKEAPALVIVLAAMVSLAPGAAVLVTAFRLQDKPPETKIIGVLATTFFRVGAVLGLGMLMYEMYPEVRAHVFPFVSWAVLFYVVTLFIETALLYIDSSNRAKSKPSGS